MTREQAINSMISHGFKVEQVGEIIKAVTLQEPTIKALGEELRKARKGIADEKVLIGYNMAVAICNKLLGESEDTGVNDTSEH